MAFDKKSYDNEYQKKYKQFKARITPEVWEELSKLLQEHSLSHAGFILQAMEDLKKKIPKNKDKTE